MLATTNNSFCYLIEWQTKEKKKKKIQMEKMQDETTTTSSSRSSSNKRRSHEIANGKFETETENKQTMNSIKVAECFAMDSDFCFLSSSFILALFSGVCLCVSASNVYVQSNHGFCSCLGRTLYAHSRFLERKKPCMWIVKQKMWESEWECDGETEWERYANTFFMHPQQCPCASSRAKSVTGIQTFWYYAMFSIRIFILCVHIHIIIRPPFTFFFLSLAHCLLLFFWFSFSHTARVRSTGLRNLQIACICFKKALRWVVVLSAHLHRVQIRNIITRPHKEPYTHFPFAYCSHRFGLVR